MSDQNTQNINDIRLTRAAALFIQKSIGDDPAVKGIRVGVKSSGCSGLSYYLEPAKMSGDDVDQVFHCHGVAIFVNQESFPYLKGIEIDCVQEGLGEYLKFNNPNVKGACGCGESFSVE